MTLRIYNSITRKKAEFIPLEAGKVKMYVCGVTVYDYCHLGHARAYVVWDMVRRYLSTKYQVRYVQNITDIDDKILNRAKERGKTMEEIAEEYIQTYNEDMAKLNILPADEYPRATESIPAIIDLIEKLIDCEYAYAVDGDVYYAVRQFPSYGKLSGRKLEDMQAGASGRVDASEPLKRYPFDFALWKAAKPDEPFWESPWGKGRPGWHIECSAMVRSRLGDSIDIHAGGADLQFPHHENEIAQSEAVTHKPLANYWMHNGFVNIEGEKMSKSLNNFTTIRALLEHYDPMAVRLFILQSHYRTPIDFTEDAINAATKAWETVKDALYYSQIFKGLPEWETASSVQDKIEESIQQFNEAMDDDFNTSVAISVIFELVKNLKTERNIFVHTGKTERNILEIAQMHRTLCYLVEILGFLAPISGVVLAQAQPAKVDITAKVSITDEQIERMIEERREARQAKNWKESDRIRDQLKAIRITLIDQPDGSTRWHR
jgi:cysteinyl-tRNA synthetase